MDALESAVVLAWMAIIFLGLAMYGLSRQVALFRAEGLHPPDASGAVVVPPDLSSLAGSGRGVVALFVDGDCRACRSRLGDLQDSSDAMPPGYGLVVVVEPQTLIPSAQNAGTGLRLPEGAQLLRLPEPHASLGIHAKPHALVLSSDGAVLDSRPLGSRQALLSMLSAIRNVTPVSASQASSRADDLTH